MQQRQFQTIHISPTVEGIVEEIFKFASLMPRVASHLEAQHDYLVDVEEVCVATYHVAKCCCSMFIMFRR